LAAREIADALNLKRPLLLDRRTGQYRFRIADAIHTNITILHSNSLRGL